MKQETKQTLFLVLIFIFIILLLFTMVYLIKNVEVIKNNPIVYGIKINNFTYCKCLKDNILINFQNGLKEDIYGTRGDFGIFEKTAKTIK